jgi:hypothetical protein
LANPPPPKRRPPILGTCRRRIVHGLFPIHDFASGLIVEKTEIFDFRTWKPFPTTEKIGSWLRISAKELDFV